MRSSQRVDKNTGIFATPLPIMQRIE